MKLPIPRYQVELVEENRSHFYDVTFKDGSKVRYPGVTGILSIINKPALVNWAKREALNRVRESMSQFSNGSCTITDTLIDRVIEEASARPDKIKDDAASLGSKVHAYIDRFVKGGKLEKIPNEILKPVSAFADWWKRSGLTFVSGDLKVASSAYGYGGSLDALAKKNGRLVLLDWKTSKAIYDEYALQAAAYVQAFIETYGVGVSEAVIVRFSKPGVPGPVFESGRLANIAESLAAFLDAKGLSEKMKQEHLIR